MDSGGKIRFFGGSKHNQILHIAPWRTYIRVPLPRKLKLVPFSDLDKPIAMAEMTIRTEEYQLTPMALGSGCRYFEYVLCGHQPDEGPRHWRIGNAALRKCDAFLRICQRKLDKVIERILRT